MSASPTSSSHKDEIDSGSRFAFGNNWTRFLSVLDEHRINEAVNSIKQTLGVDDLKGKTFLDIGSGSGLFSLAARKLGAKVFSFDYDPESVLCTKELKKRFFPEDTQWTIESGSVLDSHYLLQIGKFDIVYSWGVLHHTGDLWSALENVNLNVAEHGVLCIALYNDQGWASKAWLVTKKIYNHTPKIMRFAIIALCYLRLWGPTSFKDLIRLQPFKTWREYKKNRGMSPHRDVVDWVGGYPFEVSTPDDIFEYYSQRGYILRKLKTCSGNHGCNEFVFTRGRQ